MSMRITEDEEAKLIFELLSRNVKSPLTLISVVLFFFYFFVSEDIRIFCVCVCVCDCDFSSEEKNDIQVEY
jgi:hypothetical protein